MTIKTEPFISGKYGWDFGESGWNVGADENWLKFSYLLNGKITAIETSDANAASYADGTAYWNSSDQTINPRVNGTTRKYTLPIGFSLTSTDGSIKYEYNGSALALTMTPADKVRLDSILTNPTISGIVTIEAAGGGGVPGININKAGGSPFGGGFINFTAVGGNATITQAGPNLELTSTDNLVANTPFTFNGDVTLTGGKRIKADLSNATLTNRTMFQTTATDSGSSVGVLPNGAATSSYITTYNNSSPANSSIARVGVSAIAVTLDSMISGSGTYLPLILTSGGIPAITIPSNGRVGIGTSSPSSLLHVVGTAKVTGQFDLGIPSIAASGYSQLPNGMLIQWGTYTTVAGTLIGASFPLAFPNASLAVIGTIKNTGAFESVAIVPTSASQFNISTRQITTGSAIASTVTVLAIGY